MIKLIIFDLSGVCFNEEEPIYVKKFAKLHGLNFPEFDNYYHKLIRIGEVDKISGIDVWKRILKRYKVKDNIKKIIPEMLGAKAANKDILSLAKKLRKSHKTAYFTNYNKVYWDFLKKRLHLADYFDFGLVSYTIKSRKPSQKGFRCIMKHFGVK